KGEDALAEQSAAGEAPELASAVVGGLVDGNHGPAYGSQPLAHPAIKRDVPMVARMAHRIEIGSRASARAQQVVDSRESRSPKHRDGQAPEKRKRRSTRREGVGLSSEALAVPAGHTLLQPGPDRDFRLRLASSLRTSREGGRIFRSPEVVGCGSRDDV